MVAQTLNDRYVLHEVIGAGGMGRVHRAHDLRLDREVAVKLLRGDQVSDEVARARLRAEARIAGSLHHPGIAQVHDYDEDHASEHQDPFIVMQHVAGTSLAALLRERGTLEPAEVADLVAGVAEALDVAHRHGVVHRDLKPANIIVTPEGRPVVVDFGIASSPSREPLTATGAILGTAEYLSPEQARGRPALPASDVYALGLVAYHCLTGTSPFRRETTVATALAQVGEPLPPLDLAPDGLGDLVHAMTLKDPEERISAAEVAATLQAEAAGPSTARVGPATRTIPAPLREAGRRRRATFAGVGGGVVLLVALLASPVWSGPGTLVVPDVVGTTSERATTALEESDLDVRREVVDDARAPEGEVVGQTPEAATSVDAGSTVVLEVASGRVEVEASRYRGEPGTAVRTALEELGLVVTVRQGAATGTAGDVLDVSPSGRVPVGSTVVVTVAQAPAAPAPSATSASTGTGASTGSKPAPGQRKPKDAKAGPGAKGDKGKGRRNRD